MIPLWTHHGVATLLFLAAAVTYFKGHFLVAAVLGLFFGFIEGYVVFSILPPWTAGILVALLAVGPAIFLVVHAFDARLSLFILPTIYSIPIAYVTGALLWLVAGVSLLATRLP